MGELSVLIRKVLADKPACGYEIVQEIEERTGWEPSYGSVYPVLEQMEDNKEITGKQDGNKTTYKLTEHGEQRLRDWENNSETFFDELQEKMKILAEMTGQNMNPIIHVFEEHKHGNNPVEPIEDELETFRNTVIQHCLNRQVTHHKHELKQILHDATERVKQL